MKVLNIVMLISKHLTIVLALTFITFTILDWYNPMMGFTTNALSTKLLITFCVLAIITTVYELIQNLKKKTINSSEK